MLSGEVTNTNVILFGLTRSRLEWTIYHTRGEHANQYTTDAVLNYIEKYNNEKIWIEIKWNFDIFRDESRRKWLPLVLSVVGNVMNK